MKESIDKRLRLTDFMNAVIILLLLIGHGAYRETLHWAKLFDDKPLLRFITYVGDSQGLGAEIRDLYYSESTTINPGSTLDVWCSRELNFKVYQFPPETWDERYNHMIEVGRGSDNILIKGNLLIPVTSGEGKIVERDFDEKEGPINRDVLLAAIGSSYWADIQRSTYYMQHHVFILGLIQVCYDYIRLCFYRPMVALSYLFPQTIRK